MAVVISTVIAAVASYVATGLTYGNVVEDRADRLAAADGGLRYGLERLSDSQFAKCLSALGAAGTTVEMPTQINGADVTVTCFERDGGLSRIKAWAIIVTGAYTGGAGDNWVLKTQGAGGSKAKLLGGPVWVNDFDRIELGADLTVQDGDIWFHESNCDSYSLSVPSNLLFEPSYRGPICVDRPWDQVFEEPYQPSPGTLNGYIVDPAPDTTTYPGCTVFEPGKYTTMPALGSNAYFKSGDYWFQNFTFDVMGSTVTAGWASDQDPFKFGDEQYILNTPCQHAIDDDRYDPVTNPTSTPGATFYLGGSADIYINTHGSLEILRRLQPDGNLVSIRALRPGNPHSSSLGGTDNIIASKSGNTTDLAIHGLAWAPYAGMEFGNVTNTANGQLLGGGAFARILLQASASASAFNIRVETSPIAFSLKVIAEATKDGKTTTMSAIVQVDDRLNSAVNSVRIVE
jgi:hypothetical protein